MSFLGALALGLGSAALIGGAILLYTHLCGRALEREYAEMKEKLTPQQFDIWLDIQKVQQEIKFLEKGATSNHPFAERHSVFSRMELRELKEKENELWWQFSGGAANGNSYDL